MAIAATVGRTTRSTRGPSSYASVAILALVALVASPARAVAAEPPTAPVPFEAIAASPIVVTPDPSGRSAILTVRTTIDAACSVVYGPDERFGRIAVDADMGGGAHADHHPTLVGLEPDTEYRYRVQGTGADGTLYVSDVLTFRTPPAPLGEPANLALGAVVSDVSSEYDAAYAATAAIDGDPSTAWSSAGDGDDAWIELDLGQMTSIGTVVFRTRSMGDGTAVTQTFTLTADGEEVGTYPADVPVELDLDARVLRFDVAESTGGNTGAIEIEVLAADD
jgi:hypothetical protein